MSKVINQNTSAAAKLGCGTNPCNDEADRIQAQATLINLDRTNNVKVTKSLIAELVALAQRTAAPGLRETITREIVVRMQKYRNYIAVGACVNGLVDLWPVTSAYLQKEVMRALILRQRTSENDGTCDLVTRTIDKLSGPPATQEEADMRAERLYAVQLSRSQTVKDTVPLVLMLTKLAKRTTDSCLRSKIISDLVTMMNSCQNYLAVKPCVDSLVDIWTVSTSIQHNRILASLVICQTRSENSQMADYIGQAIKKLQTVVCIVD